MTEPSPARGTRVQFYLEPWVKEPLSSALTATLCRLRAGERSLAEELSGIPGIHQR